MNKVWKLNGNVLQLAVGAVRHATNFWIELNQYDLLIFGHLTSRQLKGNQS